MAHVRNSGYQKLWSNLAESLRFEQENTIQQHPDADTLMERVCVVVTAIACLAGCVPASVGESPKWTLIVQNMGDTRGNLLQVLKGKQLYSALYGVYREVLHELIAALKEIVAKVKTAKTTITALPHIEKFHDKEDESGNLHTTPTKEQRNSQHPPRESKTLNCSRSLKFPHGNSSPH